MCKTIRVISFVGQRPQMIDYFRLLKEQGYRYVGDLAHPYLTLQAREQQMDREQIVAALLFLQPKPSMRRKHI